MNTNSDHDDDEIGVDDDQQDRQQPPPPPLFSLANTHAFRPTISLPGNNMMESAIVNNNNNNRRRRVWNVSDTTSLRHRPVGYPPLDKKCSRRIISSSTPSVVAVRISECLRLQSISTEYDDETPPSVIAMTTDRTLLNVYLWKENDENNDNDNENDGNNNAGDNNGNIVVECVRVRGCVMTFHRVCRAILNAASSLDFLDQNADNESNIYKTSSLYEYPRLHHQEQQQPQQFGLVPLDNNNNQQQQSLAYYNKAMNGMEHVVTCLSKDRYDAQLLGMQYLVGLTDESSSGCDIAIITSMTVLGSPVINKNPTGSGTSGTTTATSTSASILLKDVIHTKWIMGLIVDRVLPGEVSEQQPASSSSDGKHKKSASSETTTTAGFHAFNSCAASLLGTGGGGAARRAASYDDHDRHQQQQYGGFSPTAQLPHQTASDEHYGGTMRSLALRVLTNALTILDKVQPNVLMSILADRTRLVSSPKLIHALLDDVQKGSCRPPTAVLLATTTTTTGSSAGAGGILTASSKLSSPHESIYALICLRILGKHNDAARQLVVGVDDDIIDNNDADDGGHQNHNNLEILEKARYIGSSTNRILEKEAKETYQVLTEDVRSC